MKNLLRKLFGGKHLNISSSEPTIYVVFYGGDRFYFKACGDNHRQMMVVNDKYITYESSLFRLDNTIKNKRIVEHIMNKGAASIVEIEEYFTRML